MINLVLPTIFRQKVITHYLNNPKKIFEVLALSVGGNEANCYLYSIAPIDRLKDVQIDKNFKIVGLIDLTQKNTIELEELFDNNKNYKFMLSYDFDFNTFKICKSQGPLNIIEKDWTNSVMGLYSFKTELEPKNVKLGSPLYSPTKEHLEHMVMLQLHGLTNFIKVAYKDKKFILNDPDVKNTVSNFKDAQKYNFRRDQKSEISDFFIVPVHFYYKNVNDGRQTQIIEEVELARIYKEFIRFVFIEDLINDHLKIIAWYLTELYTEDYNKQNKFIVSSEPAFIKLEAKTFPDSACLCHKYYIANKNNTDKLRNIHMGILHATNLPKYIIKPDYLYFHYNQDNFIDEGWGCAYRSLQTIISWYKMNTDIPVEIPSIHRIQEILVEIGDKKKDEFLGSKNWIGSFEVSFVIRKLLDKDCTMLHFQSGAEIVSYLPTLKRHFSNHGTPIMIGGGVLAYTLLGIAEDEDEPSKSQFLILDPHYKGKDELKMIMNPKSKAVYWSGAKIFRTDSFYNLCCPHM